MRLTAAGVCFVLLHLLLLLDTFGSDRRWPGVSQLRGGVRTRTFLFVDARNAAETDNPTMCHYDVLGLKKDFNEKELKKAYKNAALKYHPDKNQGATQAEKEEADRLFAAVAEAYNVLSDDKKRRYYDQVQSLPTSPHHTKHP